MYVEQNTVNMARYYYWIQYTSYIHTHKNTYIHKMNQNPKKYDDVCHGMTVCLSVRQNQKYYFLSYSMLYCLYDMIH